MKSPLTWTTASLFALTVTAHPFSARSWAAYPGDNPLTNPALIDQSYYCREPQAEIIVSNYVTGKMVPLSICMDNAVDDMAKLLTGTALDTDTNSDPNQKQFNITDIYLSKWDPDYVPMIAIQAQYPRPQGVNVLAGPITAQREEQRSLRWLWSMEKEIDVAPSTIQAIIDTTYPGQQIFDCLPMLGEHYAVCNKQIALKSGRKWKDEWHY